MPVHVVEAGESIPSIAKDSGFFWKTIWDHPNNSKLKAERQDPNVLYEGDEVFIPDLELKEFNKSTEHQWKFKRKGEPVKFKLRLLLMDQPRANEDYILIIDGKPIMGKTDGDGKLEEWIPGNARGGKLVLKGGKEEYPVMIGELDPISKISGVRQRLNNLGFACGSDGDEIDDQTREAIMEFQAKYELEVTGEPDDAFKSKLKGLHP